MKRQRHKWAFRPRFRAGAYGWRGAKIASQRLKEAVSEIKAVNRKESATAADGAILLVEKLWPALADVDTSSGALGNAVNKAVHALIDIIVAASADASLREQWLERLWTAVQEDGIDYFWEVNDRWGELCATPDRASRAADELVPIVRLSWTEEHRNYFRGTPACLSCLLIAGRHRELLTLIDKAPYLSWLHRRFGVEALAAMGRTEDAIGYALNSVGLNDSPAAVARACEKILLAAGRLDEAYERFALEANQAGTNLATCRAIMKKYPDKSPRAILDDLIAATPDDTGRWFATAKTLGYLDLAAKLASRSPVDIATLLRAARDHRETNPEFALNSATAALQWMARGRYSDIAAGDVWQGREVALQTAAAVGRLEPTREMVECLIASEGTNAFVRKQLSRPFGLAPGG
jgi:hypothetical protein